MPAQALTTFVAKNEAESHSAVESQAAVAESCNRILDIHTEQVRVVVKEAKEAKIKVGQRAIPLHGVKAAVQNMISQINSEAEAS